MLVTVNQVVKQREIERELAPAPQGANVWTRAMMSLWRSAVPQAAYFEGEVTRGREDWSAGRGELPGVWKGGSTR